MLTLRRFKELADSYGADLQRWPEEARVDAQALLEASPGAHAVLREAKALDEAIEAASHHEHDTLWYAGEQDAGLARVRAGVATRIASAPPKRQDRRREAWWLILGGVPEHPPAGFGWVGIATGSGVAITAGFLIGAFYAMAPASNAVLALLQPAPIHFLGN